jgi:uncharacterized protein (DUF1697 family)
MIALLRGINVGGRNAVAMGDVRALMADLGYAGARTLLQSGNVVFPAAGDPAAHAARIEEGVTRLAGREVRVLVRTRDDLAAIVAADLLGDVATNPSRRFVAFLERAPDPGALAAIDPADFLPERFAAAGREIAIWLPDGMQRARLTHQFWERRLGLAATLRNWNTVGKLLALDDAGA